MATGVVDQLESVQIHVTERVLCRLRIGAVSQDPRQPSLELFSIDQAREGIVRGFVGQLAGDTTLLSDVVEDQHHPGRQPVTVPNGSRRVSDGYLGSVPAQQQNAVSQVDRTTFVETAAYRALD